MQTFSVTEEFAQQRLDVFLSEHLSQSRTHIQKLIKSGAIFVNNKSCKPNTRLEIGDVVRVEAVEVEETIQEGAGAIPVLDILFEDDDLIVINKPAGLLVHPVNEFQHTPTLIDALLAHNPSIAGVGENPIRPGIVHRLDRDVSGVMVVAKTQASYLALKSQFMGRTIGKEYLALVYGTLPRDQGDITFKIARSKEDGRMVAKPESQEGKESHTEYEVLKRFINETYVRVILHTGRTHQIRVHFLALHHPLVGDELYKSRMKKIRPLKLDRVFLHSNKLRLHLLNGEERTFESPLPPELQFLLDTLR
ncbi:MAG: RluA family pseudouridine synthase [Patescibacteria group bacterium]